MAIMDEPNRKSSINNDQQCGQYKKIQLNNNFMGICQKTCWKIQKNDLLTKIDIFFDKVKENQFFRESIEFTNWTLMFSSSDSPSTNWGISTAGSGTSRSPAVRVGLGTAGAVTGSSSAVAWSTAHGSIRLYE